MKTTVFESWGSNRARLRLRWVGAGVAMLVLTVGIVSCKKSERPAPAEESSELPEGYHVLTGTVVSINADRGTLLVQHDEISGVMPAMTMEFHVAPGDVRAVREGLPIQAVMYQMSDGFWLERIWPVDPIDNGIIEAAARELRQDTVTRGSGAYREVGEDMPDFALLNQDGHAVQAAEFTDKQIVVNFIFTRCPDPTMCPAATMRMMQMQKLAREAGVPNLELVSITLDPEYDTPGVLRDYADAYGIDTTNFSFLTGPETTIKDLMTQLGVLAFQNGPLVQHTISTVLIDDEGRIIYRVDGRTWDPEDFVSRMRRPVSEEEQEDNAADSS